MANNKEVRFVIVTGKEFKEGERADAAYYYLAAYEVEKIEAEEVTGISYFTEERETFKKEDVTVLPEFLFKKYEELYEDTNYKAIESLLEKYGKSL